MHFLHTCQPPLVYAPVATTSRSNSVRALAALLRNLREEAGMRQVDLAEALDEPQSFVSRFESGERRLDVLELRAVCRALELPLDKFIRRFEKEVP
jgi:transcriptional regulator with XRE-family HTH domain